MHLAALRGYLSGARNGLIEWLLRVAVVAVVIIVIFFFFAVVLLFVLFLVGLLAKEGMQRRPIRRV